MFDQFYVFEIARNRLGLNDKAHEIAKEEAAKEKEKAEKERLEKEKAEKEPGEKLDPKGTSTCTHYVI